MNQFKRLAGFCIGLAALVATFTMLPSQVRAQSSYGAIVGTVTDASGAIVPGAAVTVTNIGTNEKRVVKTDAAGGYRVVSLVPSNYRVEVEAANFKHFVQSLVPVLVDNTIRVDAALQVGAATETVEVSTQPPLLQTESGSVGSQVEGKVVQEMPLNGRNAMNLIALVPGVIPQGGTSGAPSDNAGIHTEIKAWGNYSIGGGIANENGAYVDGAPNNLLGGNNPGLILTQDMVQEFKVATNSVSAEYGRFGGGVIEMASKSGTNGWHGSAYEYIRNTVLNANDYLYNAYPAPGQAAKPAFHQNQFGATLGGPIKKDKAFFFFSWEKFALRKAVSGDGNVPTLAMTGKADPTGLGGAIFNRFVFDNSTKHCPIQHDYPNMGQSYIPASCLDATAKVLTGMWAAPNSTNPIFNYLVSPVIGDDTKQYNIRVDYNLSSKQRLFGRYTQWPLDDIGQNDFKGKNLPLPTDYASTHNRTYNIVLGDTITINSSTIADVRLSYMRDHFWNYGSARGNTDLTKFGPAYASLVPQVSMAEIPSFIIGGPDNIFLQLPVNANQVDTYENLALSGSLTKMIGNHALKFGGEYSIRNHSGIGNNPAYAGWSFFLPFVNGDEFASFMLGEFTNDKIQTIATTFTVNKPAGLYATDTWRVSPKLTLNLGLRWEFPGGMEEKKDRTAVVLPDKVDPSTSYMGTIALVNSPMFPSRSMTPIKYNLFGPRASFAYALKSASVVRGGYGLSYLPPDMPTGLMAYNSPVAAAITQTNNNPGNPQFFLSNPWPDPANSAKAKILQPSLRTDPYPGHLYHNGIVTAPLPTTKYPYMQQWNLTFSKQWKGDWLTEVTYAGSKGTQLPYSGVGQGVSYSVIGRNELPSQYYYMGQSALSAMSACARYGGQTVQAAQCLRPFPQFQDLQDTGASGGSTHYNALYLIASKRFRSGGVLNANYTFGHMVGDTDQPGMGGGGNIQDFNNMKGEKSISGFDVKHRVVVNYVLNLPFGKGQKWLNDGGVSNVVLGGWSVNGITTFQSGFPYSFSYSGSSSNLSSGAGQTWGAGTIRPDIVPGCNLKTSGSNYTKFTTQNWFNQACLVLPGTNYTNAMINSEANLPPPLKHYVQNDQQLMMYGNAPRNTDAVRGQFLDNWDFSMSKNTAIKERLNLLFRVEFFDIFNHPQFGNAGSDIQGRNFNGFGSNGNPIPSRLIQGSLRLSF